MVFESRGSKLFDLKGGVGLAEGPIFDKGFREFLPGYAAKSSNFKCNSKFRSFRTRLLTQIFQ